MTIVQLVPLSRAIGVKSCHSLRAQHYIMARNSVHSIVFACVLMLFCAVGNEKHKFVVYKRVRRKWGESQVTHEKGTTGSKAQIRCVPKGLTVFRLLCGGCLVYMSLAFVPSCVMAEIGCEPGDP